MAALNSYKLFESTEGTVFNVRSSLLKVILDTPLEIQNRITTVGHVPKINMTASKIFTYHSYWMSLQQKFYCEMQENEKQDKMP